MANRMIWPPEKTFKYQFRCNQELDLVIPLENSTVSKVLLMLPILQEMASGCFFSGRYGFFVIKY